VKETLLKDDKNKKVVKVVSVGLDTRYREMLEFLAVKYRIPQNLSHTLRLLIEDAYAAYGGK
jgi:hypothetical protein